MAQEAATPFIPPDPAGHPTESAWGRLRRSAPWWLLPLTTVVVLGGFILYGLWTAFVGGKSVSGPYLSPFYSPQIWWNGPVSPALWVLPFPLLFRTTCYYYRKAYYRSFFWDPPGCAIGELRKRPYHGETRFPFNFWNLHRYAMYLAVVVLIFLWIDLFATLDFQGHLYLGLGTAIMCMNCIFLSCYTFGCHSVRHLVGGCVDCYSKVRGGTTRFKGWGIITKFNEHHAMWAWLSLFSVVLTDIYIRLLQHGLSDPHVWMK